MNYIYFLSNKDKQVIYIGQTNDIRKRMLNHKSNQEWWSEVCLISYSEISSKFKSDIYEKYYISRYTPIYNSNFTKEEIDFDVPELMLKDYKLINQYSFSDFDIEVKQKIKPKKKNIIVYTTDDLISKLDEISSKLDCPRNEVVLKMLEHCVKTFKTI